MAEPSHLNQLLVLGAGRVGLEVAVQCSLFGKRVAVHDVSPSAANDFQLRLQSIGEGCVQDQYCSSSTWLAARQRIQLTPVLESAASTADLVIECVTESASVKKEAFAAVGALCPPTTIFATNSSFLLPSSLARASGRPDRLAGFHFHMPVWRTRVVDVMPHHGTSATTVQRLVRFGEEIGLLPIPMRKESPGYLFNAIYLPLLFQAIRLLDRDVATMEDIDRAWMGITEMPVGPFGMLDVVGVKSACQVAEYLSETMRDGSATKVLEFLKRRIAATPSGETPTFYRYPRPAFREPGFVPPRVWPDGQRPEAGDSSSASAFQRYVPIFSPAPVHPRLRTEISNLGGVACWGGHGAAECVRTLQAAESGADRAVHWLRSGDPDASEASWQAAFAQNPPAQLLLIPDDLPDGWDQRTAILSGLESAFRVTQLWYRQMREREQLDTAGLTIVLPGEAPSAWQGLAGLGRALFMEGAAEGRLGPRLRILSGRPRPADWPSVIGRESALARNSVVWGDPAEFVARHARAEVRYQGAERQELRYAAEPAGEATRPAPTGNWLFTGGGRGITHACAAALGMQSLGMQSPVHLHLLGRSRDESGRWGEITPAQVNALRADVMRRAFAEGRKPNEAWSQVQSQIETEQNLARLNAAGIRFTFHRCDLADPEQLAATVAAIRRDGPIRGVVHGAGVEITGRFEKKTPAIYHATVDAKVGGVVELARLTRDEPLQAFIAFGSLGGRFGGVGQADYSLANEAMAAIVRQVAAHHRRARVATLHWPGWSQVGMAARPESAHRLREAGHQLLAPEVGTRLFLNELTTGRDDTDVAFLVSQELPDAWRAAPTSSK